MKKLKLSDDATYKKSLDKLLELQNSIAQKEAELTEVDEQLNQSASARQARISRDALALLDGENDSEIELTSSLRDRRQELTYKLKVLREAEGAQKERVTRAQIAASREICKKLKPEYRNIVQEIAKAAIALAHLTDKEQQFREYLLEQDVRFVGDIPPAILNGPGNLRDDYSPINIFLRGAEESGYLTKKEILK